MYQREAIVEPHPESAIPSILYEAHRKLWDSDISGSEEVLLDWLETNTDEIENIWVVSALTEITFWRFAFQESKENEEALHSMLSQLEKAAAEMYKSGDTSESWKEESTVDEISQKKNLFLHANVIYAYYYLAYSLFHLRNQENISGAFYFQRSWTYFKQSGELVTKYSEEKLKLDPVVVGLMKFGLGFFHLMLSLVPPHLRSLTNFVGFESVSRETALQELQESYHSRSTKSVEAALCLIMLHKFFYEEEDLSMELFSMVTDQYPDSIIVCYFSGFIARLTGDLTRALEHFSSLEKHSALQGSIQISTTAMYHMGYCSFLNNDWKLVCVYYEKFLDVPLHISKKRFRPYAAYQLGFAYWQLHKDSRKVQILYDRAQEWLRMHESYDIYAKRKMDEFNENNGFTEFEEILIPASAFLEGNQFERGLKLLDENQRFLEEVTQDDLEKQAIVRHVKGGCLKGAKKFEEAKAVLEDILEIDEEAFVKEKHILPYTCMLLGEVAMEEKQWETANDYFTRVKDYKSYDWQRLVSMRLYSNQQKLEVLRKKTN